MGLLDKLDDALDTVTGPLAGAADRVADRVVEGVKDIGEGFKGVGYDLFVEPYEKAGTGAKWYDVLGSGLLHAAGDVGQILGGGLETVTSPLMAFHIDAPQALAAGYQTVDRNLATVALMSKLAGEEGAQDFTDADAWHRASEIRRKDNITLGGSLALQLMNGSIKDQAAIQNYQQGRLFKTTSGLIDVAAPFFIDPLVIAGKAGQAARLKYIVKPINATDNLDELILSKDVADFSESIRGLTPAEIVEKYKHKGMTGVDAQILAFASEEGTLNTALLSLMGHKDAPAVLSQQASAVSAQIERLKGERDYLQAAGHIEAPYQLTSADNPLGPYRAPSQKALEDTQRELDAWYDQAAQLVRLDQRYNTLNNVPHTSTYTEARHTVLRSDWFQNGKTATPLRVVYQQNPKGILHLDDANAHTQVRNMLQHAPLTNQVRDGYVNEFLNARSATEKLSIVNRARDEAIDAILTKHGISDADKAQIFKDMNAGIGQANLTLQSIAFDGKGRGTVTVMGDGGPKKLVLPLTVTQGANLMALPDLLRLDNVAARYSPNRKLPGGAQAGRAYDMSTSELERFQSLWKAGTLLRVAYPIRVVGEEQLRLIAQYGVMARMKYAGQGVMNKGQDWAQVGRRVEQAQKEFEQTHGRSPNPREDFDLRNKVAEDYYKNDRIRGARQPEYMGIQYAPALGGDGKIFNTLLDTRALHDETWGRDVLNNDVTINQYLDDGRKLRGTGQFQGGIEYNLADGSVNPQWQRSWEVAVTRQLGTDLAARKIMQGADYDGMLAWTRTAEGKAYLARLDGYWQDNPELWLENLIGHVEDYLPTPGLKEMILSGKLDRQKANDEFEAHGVRPVVHGEVLEAVRPDNPTWRAINKITQEGYKALAQQPTYVLSRVPAFHHSYTREMNRMLERYITQTGFSKEHIQLDTHRLEQFQRAARQTALADTRKLLFDLSSQSDLSHTLRFISPFFNAFEEVLRTWGRLAIEHPTVIPQMHNLWEAPDRAGLTTTDSYGEERIIIPLPGDGWDLPGVGKIDQLNLSKRGLNTILNMPGTGPIGTVPVAEVLKNRPDVQSTKVVEFLYPYGVPSSLGEAVVPKFFKNIASAKNAFDRDYQDKRYLSNWMSIYATEYTNYRLGKRSTEPSREEIDERAEKLMMIRVAVDFVAPTSTSFDSPYQPLIDEYRRLQEKDPENADARFYELHGDDYFMLTYHLSKNTAGVPATLEAWKDFDKHKTLLAEHPEYGAIITGDAAWQGSFNRAVNDWLTRTRLPGSTENLRQIQSPNAIIESTRERAGWIEFNKFMTAINAEMDARGVERITDKSVKDLAQLKRDYINNAMKTNFPEWYDSYTNWDLDKSQKRAEALKEIAYSPNLSGRTDIAGLREYLSAREDFMNELQARKQAGDSGDLEAKANDELRGVWKGWVSELVQRNPRFAPLYNRYFDNDHLAVK